MSGLIPLRIKPDTSVGLMALAFTCRLSNCCLPVSVKKVPSTTLGWWSCWPHHVTWPLRPLVTIVTFPLAIPPCRWWRASWRWAQSYSTAQAQKVRRGDRESYCPRWGSKNRDVCFLLSILLLQNMHLFCTQPRTPKRYLIPV